MKNYKERLHNSIPGGAHTYSRGDDQFPSNAPPILSSGKGAYVYDTNGQEYLDYGMGLRSVNIGYGNKEVADAAYQEIIKGNNLTRASLTELNAAELLIDLIPSVEMVKFAKHGSTVTTAAIKLARAYTNRKYIAVPAEQPFFSFNDWFISSTEVKKGTLKETEHFTLKFNYNDISSLEELYKKYPDQIAGVILEPATSLIPCISGCQKINSCRECPENGNNFLNQVRALTKKHKSVFILDEMITGFRWHVKGAQYFYNVDPDLCTFGKAMANGFAVAALCGKEKIMSLGSIRNIGAERVFLTSTTHGAEMSSLGAFIKTIEILKRDNVIQHIWDYGSTLIKEANSISKKHGLSKNVIFNGLGCSPNYLIMDNQGNNSLSLRTLFLQEMMKEKILIPYIALSFSHGDSEMERTLFALDKSFGVIKKAIDGQVDDYLNSEVVKPVFRKYN